MTHTQVLSPTNRLSDHGHSKTGSIPLRQSRVDVAALQTRRLVETAPEISGPPPVLTGREPLRQNIVDVIQVPRDLKVAITTKGLLVDADETLILRSGNFIHDGPVGRFAIAVTMALKEQAAANVPFLNSDQARNQLRLTQNVTCFDDVTWAPFRKLTGGPEAEVIEDIRKLAASRLNVHVSPERFNELIDLAVKTNFQAMVDAGVGADDDLRNRLISARSKGISNTLCTASGQSVIATALNHFGIGFPGNGQSKLVFDQIICGAEKKTHNGFSEKGFSSAAKLINLAPKECVAIGDGMPDIMGSFLAGCSTVVIRIPVEKEMSKEWASIEERLETALRSHTLPISDSPFKVYLVHSFDQLAIDNCGDKNVNGFVFNPHAQDTAPQN